MSEDAAIIVIMKTLLAVLNVLSFAISFGAILWAWVVLRRDVQANDDLLERLKAIDEKYEREPADAFVQLIGGPTDRQQEKIEEWRRTGKQMFTYNEMNHMPELVKSLIYMHAASGLGAQVWLVGLGLLIGTVANVWSLFIS